MDDSNLVCCRVSIVLLGGVFYISWIFAACSKNCTNSIFDMSKPNDKVMQRFYEIANKCDKVEFVDSLYKGYFNISDFYDARQDDKWSIDNGHISRKLFAVDRYTRDMLKEALDSISHYKLPALAAGHSPYPDLRQLDHDIQVLYLELDCINRRPLAIQDP